MAQINGILMVVENMNNGDNSDILARLPRATDTNEVRITKTISDELLRSDWARSYFDNAKRAQIDFFKFSLSNLDNPRLVYSKTQELLKRLAQMGRVEIASGEENLNHLPSGQPFIIATNHLGDYKLSAIHPSELGLTLETDQIHPFPMYYAPYSLIAERQGVDVSAAHIKLLEPLNKIEEASGLVTIVVKEDGLPRLEKATNGVFDKHHNTALVVFPEGGTTGKRNGGGPYDLERFHAGAFVIAGHLGLPLLPVAKYFDPNEGYKLGVLPAIHLEKDGTYDDYRNLAESVQRDMQAWLNTRKAA